MTAFPSFSDRATTHSLTANDVTMRVVTEGSGANVVFIPGGDQTAALHDEVFDHFPELLWRLTRLGR